MNVSSPSFFSRVANFFTAQETGERHVYIHNKRTGLYRDTGPASGNKLAWSVADAVAVGGVVVAKPENHPSPLAKAKLQSGQAAQPDGFERAK